MKNKLQDWQLGNESKMTSLDRMIQHQIWLKLQHEELKNKIQSKIEVEVKPIVGFIKD